MVDSILSGDLPTPSKKKWSDLVWGIDDDYWRSVNTMNKGNDLLASTMEGIRYMVWWQMSDAETSMIKECECIAKILCHKSLQKVDDFRLKDQPPSSKMC